MAAAPPTSGRIISPRSATSGRSKVGKEHIRELAGGTRRQGQRRRLRAGQADPDSIGYVELIYAIQNNIPYGLVKNRPANSSRRVWPAFRLPRRAPPKPCPTISASPSPMLPEKRLSHLQLHLAADSRANSGCREARRHQGIPDVDDDADGQKFCEAAWPTRNCPKKSWRRNKKAIAMIQ